MPDAGIDADAGGHLAAAPDFLAGWAVERSVQHAAGEVEPAVVEITPQAPDALRRETSLLVADDRGSATGKAGAVGGIHCGLKEGLRCDCRRTARAASGKRSRATQALLDGCISFGEALPAQGHHVRDSVDVDRLIFMGNSAANVAHFQ